MEFYHRSKSPTSRIVSIRNLDEKLPTIRVLLIRITIYNTNFLYLLIKILLGDIIWGKYY